MTASMIMQKLHHHNGHMDSPGSTERSLAAELEQTLTFRPEMVSALNFG